MTEDADRADINIFVGRKAQEKLSPELRRALENLAQVLEKEDSAALTGMRCAPVTGDPCGNVFECRDVGSPA
jgi:hypothetical protein